MAWTQQEHRRRGRWPPALPRQSCISADGRPGPRVLDARAVSVAPTEARWLSVTLRVPPQTAAGMAAGAQAIQFGIDRMAQGAETTRTLCETSTFVLPR